MDSIVIIGVFAAATIGLGIYAVYHIAFRRKTILAERLETYAGIEEEAARAATEELQGMNPIQRVMHLLLGRGYMENLESTLTRADIPMRPTEYVLLRVVLAAVGLLIGLGVFGYPHSGIILAIAGFMTPVIFLKVHERRRRDKFVRQLADALMLLTNSLRSGYSFLKGLELVAKEMDDPISKELNRMLREVNLGASIEDALLNLGRRLHSPDLDIVISAYLVQKDVGGNLTEIMEKVAETIRERLRIQGDIKVLTAQGRLSGAIVGLLPVALFALLMMWAPDYFRVMIEPPKIGLLGGLEIPLGILLLVAALLWQLLGAYLIYKIIQIKV